MDRDVRNAQAFFGSKADAYRQSRSHGNADDLARMIRLVAPVTEGSGVCVLDVATGGGHTAQAFEAVGARVVAVDVTREMLTGMDRVVALSDVHDLPFRDGVFDVVACRIAAHHFHDLARAVSEMARVLAAGGRLYVFDLASPRDPFAQHVIDRIERLRDPSHVWSHDADTWRRTVTGAGLDIEVLDETTSRFPLAPWLARARMSAAAEDEIRRLLAGHSPQDLGGYGLMDPETVQVLRVEIVARRAA